MAWICSVESEVLVLHLPNGSGQLPIAKSTPTHKQCLPQECQSEDCQSHQSGMMCERCQHPFFQQSQILSMGGSHAKISALQDVVRAWQESEADYFSRSCDLSEKYSQPLFSWKTCQLSELVDLIQSLKKLPIVGMIVDGRIYQHQKLERTTGEIDGGYWATPTVAGNYNRKGVSKNSGNGLATLVAMFPTPAARDWKDNGKSPAELARNSTTLATKAGGQLNPQWVEWLMGYPFEWTELNALVMPLFQKQRGKRL